MKPKKPAVSYFPVEISEQALLLRVREPDLAGRIDELVEMMGLLAEARLTSAELELAIRLLRESQENEGVDARFDNLEARLKERMERGLAEIEGRLSRRLAPERGVVPEGPVEAAVSEAPAPRVPVVAAPKLSPQELAGQFPEVPPEASLAIRIGSELVWGTSAAQFYVAVWRWLFEHGHVRLTDLPIGSGKKRYTVAATPKHPGGGDFFLAREVVPGAWLEMNMSRDNIISRTRRVLEAYGVEFVMVVGSEG